MKSDRATEGARTRAMKECLAPQ